MRYHLRLYSCMTARQVVMSLWPQLLTSNTSSSPLLQLHCPFLGNLYCLRFPLLHEGHWRLAFSPQRSRWLARLYLWKLHILTTDGCPAVVREKGSVVTVTKKKSTDLQNLRDSVVSIATRYELDGPGIESRWWRDFQHPSRPALGSTHFPVQWVPDNSRG
jgi:hypothetical protein